MGPTQALYSPLVKLLDVAQRCPSVGTVISCFVGHCCWWLCSGADGVCCMQHNTILGLNHSASPQPPLQPGYYLLSGTRHGSQYSVTPGVKSYIN